MTTSYLVEDNDVIKKFGSGFGSSVTFSGSGQITVNGEGGTFPIPNTFTIEFWASPEMTHEIDGQSQSSTTGIAGQRYIIGPHQAGSNSGVGISLAGNGISVYEHGDSYMPPLLVHPVTLTGWHHFAIVYNNKLPKLYIDGVFVKDGLASVRGISYPSNMFGNNQYGGFVGKAADYRLWTTARTEAEIKANMSKRLNGDEAGLYLNLAMQDMSGTVLEDSSINNKDATMAGGATWDTSSPVAATWSVVGPAPATQEMFVSQGMTKLDVNTIPDTDWQSHMKILAYDTVAVQPTVDITVPGGLYQSVDKLYKGTGTLETIPETLTETRKSLIINAEHTGCVFEYSVDNGVTWYNYVLKDITDISALSGNALVIRVTLTDDTSELTAISYAWA